MFYQFLRSVLLDFKTLKMNFYHCWNVMTVPMNIASSSQSGNLILTQRSVLYDFFFTCAYYY